MRLKHFAFVLLLGVFLVSCGAVTSSPAQTFPTPSTGNGIPQMGITYTAPNSSPVISKGQAIQIALHSTLADGSGATNSTPTYARYVILHEQNAVINGQISPSFPAWVVTFEGVNVISHGKNGGINHELYIVVNAQTGKAVSSFSYR